MYLHRSGGEKPSIERKYDADFKMTPAYHASIPDMMDAEDAIQGAAVPIQQEAYPISISPCSLKQRLASW